MGVGSRKLGVGSWELEVGGWELEVWELQVASWKSDDRSKIPVLNKNPFFDVVKLKSGMLGKHIVSNYI